MCESRVRVRCGAGRAGRSRLAPAGVTAARRPAVVLQMTVAVAVVVMVVRGSAAILAGVVTTRRLILARGRARTLLRHVSEFDVRSRHGAGGRFNFVLGSGNVCCYFSLIGQHGVVLLTGVVRVVGVAREGMFDVSGVVLMTRMVRMSGMVRAMLMNHVLCMIIAVRMVGVHGVVRIIRIIRVFGVVMVVGKIGVS